MPKLSKKQVEHIGKLSRLYLTEKQIEKFTNQLSAVLDYIEELSKVETKNLEPIGNITGLFNVWREDKIKPSFPSKEMLKNAPEKEGSYLKVKAVLE